MENKLEIFVALLFVFLLLVLDWLALDDITTGNEPDLWGEYAILTVSLVIFGILIYRLKYFKDKNV